MTERSSSQGQPDDWSNSSYGAAETRSYPTPGSGAGAPGGYGAGAGAPGGYGAGAGAPGGYGAAAGAPGGYGAGAGAPPVGTPQHSGPGRAADSKGFLASLFDFSFTSFITTKVIKVIYVLATILIFLAALSFTFEAFHVSTVFGLVVLVIGDPLYIIIAMALWRLLLEFFIVIFRMGDDIRTIRDRGEMR